MYSQSLPSKCGREPGPPSRNSLLSLTPTDEASSTTWTRLPHVSSRGCSLPSVGKLCHTPNTTSSSSRSKVHVSRLFGSGRSTARALSEHRPGEMVCGTQAFIVVFLVAAAAALEAVVLTTDRTRRRALRVLGGLGAAAGSRPRRLNSSMRVAEEGCCSCLLLARLRRR